MELLTKEKEVLLLDQDFPQGVQPFGVSAPHWKKNSNLGPHIKYTATHNHKQSHNVLSKFTILCWAASIAILGCMGPAGHRLDTLARAFFYWVPSECSCLRSATFSLFLTAITQSPLDISINLQIIVGCLVKAKH